MADQGDNNFIRYVYRGEVDEFIPEATHIIVHKDVTVILRRAFEFNRNIIEVICHENVERIEGMAFSFCRNLRRVIMPGVKEVETRAFIDCDALTDVDCDMLHLIGPDSFMDCKSLSSMNLPSARIVGGFAFHGCIALTDVKFSAKLERIKGGAFLDCPSLQRITIPLKDGVITDDNIFAACVKLTHVDLVEGELHEAIAALQLEDWRHDIRLEIDSINRILPNTPSGNGWNWDRMDYGNDVGEKAQAIRTWLRSVLGKIVHYRAGHERLLNEEVEPTLQVVLPQDLVRNNVVSFLALPLQSFEDNHDVPLAYSEGEDSGMEVDSSDDEEV